MRPAGSCVATRLVRAAHIWTRGSGTLRIGLAQIAPRLGVVEANLDKPRRVIAEARGEGVDLLVFPELGLTGYLLQDLNAEVAMRRDDARLRALAADAAGMSTSSASSRSRTTSSCTSPRHCSRTARVSHVYRKSYLPNYGLFDERRFFGAGDAAARRRLAARRPPGPVHLRGLLASARAVSAGARRRPDAGQHLVLARPRRRRGGRGRSGHGRRRGGR